MVISQAIHGFLDNVSDGSIEVYNEASVQLELAIFLRSILPVEYKIQLERNIDSFGLTKKSFLKKEMDIVVVSSVHNERYCIEIAFPRNGQYPEQMFKICKDIRFLEELVQAGFSRSYCLVLADDHLFYSSKGDDGIYKLFRKDKQIHGLIRKPTGRKDEIIQLRGSYGLEWKVARGALRYFIVAVGKPLHTQG